MLYRFAFVTIWVFVFTIGCENMLMIPGVGTVSRLFGMLAFVIGIVAFTAKPENRQFKAFHIVMTVFIVWGMLSFIWTIDEQYSMVRLFTRLQLLPFMWLIWQFVSKEKDVNWLYQAYVLGVLLSITFIFIAFAAGQQRSYLRYSAKGFNENDIAVMMAIAIPVAWYLSLVSKKIVVKWLNRLFIPCALIGITLTASRAGIAVAGASIVGLILFLGRMNIWNKLLICILLGISVVAVIYIAPESSIDRILTLKDEVTSGTWNKRLIIWEAGLSAWRDSPFFGMGIGAFKIAVSKKGIFGAAHNTYLEILVEEGAVGLGLFLLMISIMLYYSFKMAPLERNYQLIVLFSVLLGILTLSWSVQKSMWLMFGLLASQVYAQKEKIITAKSGHDHKLVPLNG